VYFDVTIMSASSSPPQTLQGGLIGLGVFASDLVAVFVGSDFSLSPLALIDGFRLASSWSC
jgi:hypothetical protein